MLKKTLIAAGIAATGLIAAPALADNGWHHGHHKHFKHHGHRHSHAVVYVAPRPVYVRPAPVVVYAPPPAPVVYYPAPAPVYYPGPGVSISAHPAPGVGVRLNLPL